MSEAQDDYLSNVSYEENITHSKYVKLSRLTFTRLAVIEAFKATKSKAEAVRQQDNKVIKWDLSLRPNSVACVLYHRSKNALLFVKQFRPAIFVAKVCSMPENVGKPYNEIQWSKYPTSIAVTIELCAGLIDKPNLNEAQHMVEEIEEECGYSVKESDLKLLKKYVTGIGSSGALQSLYYAEIDEFMKIGEGGGVDNEKIEKVFMSLDEAKEYLNRSDVMSAPGLLYGLSWFFENIQK